MTKNFFSQANLKMVPNNDEYLSFLAKKYYWDHILNELSDDGIQSWKITLEEAIDRFKELEDTHYPLEHNEETKFLSQKYIFPEEFDENFIWKCRGNNKFLEQWWLFDKILDLNPELKNITLKNDKDKFTLLDWVVSRFPSHDIKYFIECLDSSCANEIRNNENFFNELQNTNILNIVSTNIWIFWKIVEKNSNELKTYLSDAAYERITWFSSFEAYEKWVHTMEITQTYEKETDKEFHWLYIEPKVVFSFYHKRDTLNILNYPDFAYSYLKDYIENNYLTPNSYNDIWRGNFWYWISPKSLEMFFEKNEIKSK